MNRNPRVKNLKPFKKGHDPRRKKLGPVAVERSTWTTLFLNRLAERLDPKVAADILASAYEAKRPWAISEVHERLMGKVTQPITGEMAHTLKFKFGSNGEGVSNGD